MTEVLFPQLSDQDPDGEGVLATWFVDDGAAVAGGKLIAEVMVGKVTSEVNAPVPGVIHLRSRRTTSSGREPSSRRSPRTCL